MYFIDDFVKFILQRVKSIPSTAILPIPREQCCTVPTHYLLGTVNHKATKSLIDLKWKTYYSKHWSEASYRKITDTFKPTDYCTDCQGMLDWFMGKDVNANYNYNNYCTDRILIKGSTRPYVIGEALFRKSGDRMAHVGWIVGFDSDGEPLVGEARGLKLGVGIWRLCDRNFTHRGLMTKIFDYEVSPSPNWVKFEVTKPYKRGPAYLAMQKALNAAGYRDKQNKKLSEDSKWGPKSQYAFDTMIKNHER